MGSWILFWKYFFFASLLLFTGLAVVVSIGGIFNIFTLLKSLKVKHEEQGDEIKK